VLRIKSRQAGMDPHHLPPMQPFHACGLF
jgi:hypothetical protein